MDGYVILLDRKTRKEQEKIKRLIRGDKNFIFGVAIEEIEAWWLGDRTSTTEFLGFATSVPANTRYGQPRYKAEKDNDPKKILNELTELSDAVTMRYGNGNTSLANDFAEVWIDCCRIEEIENQCPKGFKPFCRKATNFFNSQKTTSHL